MTDTTKHELNKKTRRSEPKNIKMQKQATAPLPKEKNTKPQGHRRQTAHDSGHRSDRPHAFARKSWLTDYHTHTCCPTRNCIFLIGHYARNLGIVSVQIYIFICKYLTCVDLFKPDDFMSNLVLVPAQFTCFY